MHSRRMLTARSSSRKGGVLSASVHAEIHSPGPGHLPGPGSPLGVGLDTPLGVGLDNIPRQTPQPPPWVWA